MERFAHSPDYRQPAHTCPLLSSSLSYQVLYYNLISSGQTVSVLKCDWEGEVVVMECTQNGDWKSINQQDGVCNANTITSQTTDHVSTYTSKNIEL